MRLAWTAVVPRSLVDQLDPGTMVPHGSRVLTVLDHPDPDLRVVRCYQRDRRAAGAPAA